jgi:hypothetical protein
MFVSFATAWKVLFLQGVSHYAVSTIVEDQLNEIRLHLLNVCQSASLMDNLSQVLYIVS